MTAHMKVLLTFGTAAFLLLAGIVTVMSQAETGTIRAGSLSLRAREFAKKQSQNQESGEDYRRLDAPTQTPLQTNLSFVTPCFRFSLPYTTVNAIDRSENATCRFQARIVSPPAQFTIGSYLASSVADDASIQMRLRETQRFRQRPINFEGEATVLIFVEEDVVTVFRHDNGIMVTFSFTSLQNPDSIHNDDIQSILKSIELSASAL